MHWGEEYRARPNAAQAVLARWLIDHGADAVIGAHPHWVQSISSYRGRPIAYSLGNFVFDQDFSQETRSGLMVGLAVDDVGASLDLYPISIDASRPRRLEGDERRVRLEALAAISDPGLAPAVRQGTVRLTREP
jgi:poly-gamma-glutamate synthesis protein (capsule biosynthesis protein)